MARTSVPIQGGVAVVETRQSGGAVIHVHTGDVSLTLRLSRVAAARLGDALDGIVTEQLTQITAAVDKAVETRAFRERIEGAPR